MPEMIARQATEVFVKYDGNSDAFARIATPQERALLSSEVVSNIEAIIMRLSLIQSGAASSSYAADTAALVSERNIESSALRLLENFVANRQVA